MNAQKWTAAIIDFVLTKSKISIVLVLIIIGGLISQVPKLKEDFSYRIWFSEDDPLLAKFDAFERKFGNDENVAILIETPNGVFTKESVELIQKITEKMWLAPSVIRVDSLSNHNFTEATEDELKVDPFLPEGDELSEEYLARKKQLAMKDEVIPQYLMSSDAKSAMIFAKMKPALEEIPMYKDTLDYARNLEKEFGDGKHKFHIAGSAAINVTFQEVSEHDMKTMLPILLGLVVLFLIYSFRGIGGVIYAFMIIAFSILAAFGIGAASGFTFNVMLSAVPSTLIAICIADIVHVLMSYAIFRKQGQKNIEAIRSSLDKNLMPTLVTSISTAIGFFSLAPAKIIPIANMGMMNGYGTILAWFVTIFLAIPLLKYFPLKNIKEDETSETKTSDYIGAKSKAYTKFLVRFRIPVLISMILLTIGSFVIALDSEVNSDPYEYFTHKVPLRVANETMEKDIGGSMGAEIELDSGSVDGVKDPEFLRKAEQFQNWLMDQYYVSKVVGVLDIIKGMNRSLNAGQQEFYKLEDDQNVIAQQLFLYTMSLPQGMDLNNRITLDNQQTRMTVLMNIHDSKTVLEEFDKWEAYAKSIGLNASVSGKVPLYQKMNGYIVETFFESMGMALVLVSILMIIIFKSWKIGLLSMIPNAVPIVIGGAIMHLLNIPIDMGTVVIISCCLGIAVDDTIHFLANYLKHRRDGYSSQDSIAKVLTFTGPALVLTTVILICGFGTLAFATFNPNINFGIMTAIVLGTALIVDFTLLPAILLSGKKDA